MHSKDCTASSPSVAHECLDCQYCVGAVDIYWQWSFATKEKQRASANFVKAYNTLSTLTQLSRHYGIKDPAQEKTLADLTKAIRPYYQEVLDEAQRNADSVDALDLARAHSGIAQLHLLSSEHVSAAQHFQKALNILAGEGRGDPISSSDARRLSAASLVSLATAYRRDNQRDAALAVYHQAEGLLNQLVDSGELPFEESWPKSIGTSAN